MENGSAGGSGDRDRRKTVSGPRPEVEQDKTNHDGHIKFEREGMKLPWSSSSAPTSPGKKTSPTAAPKPTGHKRSFSGSIFQRLNFLRNAGEDGGPASRGEQDSPKSIKSRKSIDDDGTLVSPVSPGTGENAMAAALKPAKTRKRKGSLRKTALLGGRRLVTEGRERRTTLLQRSPSSKQSQQALPQHLPSAGSTAPFEDDFNQPHFPLGNESSTSLHNKFSYEKVSQTSPSSDSGWSESPAVTSTRLSLLTDHHADRKASNELASPLDLKSPTSQASYASTTDDDDILTFDRPANSLTAARAPLSTIATSYFPSLSTDSLGVGASRRLSHKSQSHRSSPLSHAITSPPFPEVPQPHDYTETEYWGWVILFVTWVTFTVGMGSCLDVWSWAWDVGETPYAPPELENDDTLPVVGYYPSLMVLTGVVAWVWISVAWVGMKYFRHAKSL